MTYSIRLRQNSADPSPQPGIIHSVEGAFTPQDEFSNWSEARRLALEEMRRCKFKGGGILEVVNDDTGEVKWSRSVPYKWGALNAQAAEN
jgi:hypothetical protein